MYSMGLLKAPLRRGSPTGNGLYLDLYKNTAAGK